MNRQLGEHSPAASRRTICYVGALLAVHALVLGWHASCHSPTFNELGHLPAGIAHWRYAMFHLYRVNPPLPRMIAAVPVLLMNPATDWTNYQMNPSSRETIPIGIRFAKANGPRTLLLFTVARWACIPFSLLGALVCYHWAADLWGCDGGLLAMMLWVFNPMIIGHGAYVMPDVPAAATGALACYLFSKWLKCGTWPMALLSGAALGLAQLCKTTLLVLFLIFLGAGLMKLTRRLAASQWKTVSQLLCIACLAVYAINLGYAFVGTGKRLREYQFQSQFLGGRPDLANHRMPNRFQDTFLENIPIPLPEDYVLGIDRQKADFEIGERSYLCGTWKEGGWWYYHLLGLLIKTPAGTLLLVLLTACSTVRGSLRQLLRIDLFLLLPAVMILVIVSSQTGFSNHLRYMLPAFPFVFIWCGKLAQALQSSFLGIARLLGLTATIASSIAIWPHSDSFFNILVGGPENGHHYLLESNVAWGQDLFFLRDWVERHPEARPLHLAHFGWIDPSVAGIHFKMAPRGPNRPLSTNERSMSRSLINWDGVGPAPGWHIIDVNFLKGTHWPVASGNWLWTDVFSTAFTYEYFNRFVPQERIGFSYCAFFLDQNTCNAERARLGLPPLQDTMDADLQSEQSTNRL